MKAGDFDRLIRGLAEKVHGPVRWTTDLAGYCKCPGANRHTATETPNDCLAVLGAEDPMFICLHDPRCRNEADSAADEHERAVRVLRNWVNAIESKTGLRLSVEGKS